MHSGFEHLEALIRMAADLGAGDLVIHAFTDGRDTLPKSGEGHLETVEGWCADAGAGRVGSVIGRYFAMDRDKRWDRVQKAYDLPALGEAPHRAGTAAAAAREAYSRDETDEFIEPTLVGDEDSTIRPGDSVIGLNFGLTGCARSCARWRSPSSTRSTATAASRCSTSRAWPSTTSTGTTPSRSRPRGPR